MPGRGRSPAAWLDGLERELRERIAAADPIDPGIPAPSEPWAADVLPLLPLERRGTKLYLPGAEPSLEGRSAEAEALERELAAAGVRATKVGDDELARFLEASGKLVRLGDGYAIGAGGVRGRAGRAPDGVHARAARSRSRASATSWAWAGATRSSCSSGSTPTA